MPLAATSETLYFSNPAGQLYYHPTGYARIVWSPGRMALPAVQAFYEEVLKLALRTGRRHVLSEHGQRAPLSPEVQHWLDTNWMPRAMQQTGGLHWAVVDGQDPVHRLATQAVMNAAPTGMVIKRFADHASATFWLLKAE